MKTILVVEDTPVVAMLITHTVLHNTPYFVIVVHSCVKALEVTLDIKPDIFLFDYCLPIMNGIELYDQLHARKSLRDVPAVILSTLVEQPYVRKQIGQRNLYSMEKPLQFPVFLQLVDQLLTQEVGL